MSDLVAFLRARLDADEAEATDLHDGRTCAALGGWDRDFDLPRCDCGYPARVLREVAAKRAIIERYERACAVGESLVSFTRGQDDGYRQACLDAIADAASVYSGHPDYAAALGSEGAGLPRP